jgi:hypothetical protein
MFQLVFRGECAEGTDEQTARQNARALFKATVEQVDKMFSGQPVVIRNRLEEDQAEKYRAVLRKHGMIAYVQPMGGAAPEARKPEAGTASPSPAKPAQAPAAAPEPRAESPQANASPGPQAPAGKAPEVEPGDRLPVAGEKVDSILAGSGLTLDPVGVTLEEHREVEAPMFQHLDDWSLAPPGSDLGVKRETPPPVVPDVSHLSLADDDGRGSDA